MFTCNQGLSLLHVSSLSGSMSNFKNSEVNEKYELLHATEDCPLLHVSRLSGSIYNISLAESFVYRTTHRFSILQCLEILSLNKMQEIVIISTKKKLLKVLARFE